MCRNIKTLFNFEPPATDDEVRAASLQFVRKLSGFKKPSKANEAAFELGVEQVAGAARTMLDAMGNPSRAAQSRGGGRQGPRKSCAKVRLGTWGRLTGATSA